MRENLHCYIIFGKSFLHKEKKVYYLKDNKLDYVFTGLKNGDVFLIFDDLNKLSRETLESLSSRAHSHIILTCRTEKFYNNLPKPIIDSFKKISRILELKHPYNSLKSILEHTIKNIFKESNIRIRFSNDKVKKRAIKRLNNPLFINHFLHSQVERYSLQQKDFIMIS
ncbi:MAG: hypothetical protein ACP6IS_10100 [Candidatus Asgardarchaeia archaeon]